MNILKLRLASAFLLSKQPVSNFPKSVKPQQSLRESPVPTKTRTFVPGATQATAPRAALVPPWPSSCRPGSPGCRAASGRPPSHASRRSAGPRHGPWPGPRAPGGASPAVPTRRPRRKQRDAGSTSAGQLGTSGRAALRPRRTCDADAGSEPLPGRRPLERALQRTCPPSEGPVRPPGAAAKSPSGARPRARAEAGFQAAPKSVRAAAGSETRAAPGPRRTNGRNGSAEGEGAEGQGPGAERAAGPAP